METGTHAGGGTGQLLDAWNLGGRYPYPQVVAGIIPCATLFAKGPVAPARVRRWEPCG